MIDEAIGALGALYRLLDRDVAEREAESSGRLACPAGCSECCRANLFVTTGLEFAYLARAARGALSRATLDAVVEEARSQWARFPLRQTLRAERSGPRDLRDEGLPCPLLADGRCLVYAARPVTCRLFGRSCFATGVWNGCELLAERLTDGSAGELPIVEGYSGLLADLLHRRLSADALEQVIPLTGVCSLIGFIAETEFDEARIAHVCRVVQA